MYWYKSQHPSIPNFSIFIVINVLIFLCVLGREVSDGRPLSAPQPLGHDAPQTV